MVGNGGCFCRKICYNSVILFEGEPDLKLSRLVFPPDGASRGTLRAHRAYLAVLLTLLGVGIGFLGLWLTACADAALPQAELYRSYLDHPLLLALNLFPPLLLAWLGYFLSGRCWCGVLLSGLFGVGLPLINYYKVMLRGDPMRASDILLLRTAGGIMSQYEFERTAEVNMAVALLGAMLAFAVLLMPRGDKRRRARALGAAACVLLGVGAYLGAYTDEAVYGRTANDALINIWSDNEVYLSRGFALSFLHSVPELFPEKPEGYDARAAQTLLESFPDEDIPEGEKIAVMGVMLEAFCDLTDFDALAGFDTVQEVYAPWHALEEQSLSGRLLTNIFAGGTVDTEWGFLTGASEHDEYRGATGSYVRYFTAQGYAAHYAHPGYSWFYDRERVNDYLGFERSVFTENGFGELVDPYVAMWHSDQQLADYLLADLDAADGSPLFSFAVSYQNHGPYAETESTVPYVSPEASGWSQESCNMLNNYLFGVNETVREYVRLTQELDARDTPVVLVLFGDHKPWMGNGGSVYEEMGIDFDTSTLAGLPELLRHALSHLGESRGEGGPRRGLHRRRRRLFALLPDDAAVRRVRLGRPRLYAALPRHAGHLAAAAHERALSARRRPDLRPQRHRPQLLPQLARCAVLPRARRGVFIALASKNRRASHDAHIKGGILYRREYPLWNPQRAQGLRP